MWGIKFCKMISQFLVLFFFVDSNYANTLLFENDTTSKPEVYIENIHNVVVKWKFNKYSFFTIGTTPKSSNILSVTQIKKGQHNTGGHSYFTLKKNADSHHTPYTKSTPFYITLNNGLENEWVSPPLVFKDEKLGLSTNKLCVRIEKEIAYGNYTPFTDEEENLLLELINIANPIIREIYGPPANNINISLVQGGCDNDLNIYLKGSNEIQLIAKKNNYGDFAHPRLLIHELVHAYRDNVVLTSDSEWRFDPTLSGFEEGMAEAVAIIVMDEIVKRHPTFFKSPQLSSKWNHAKNMSHEWDYDFQNQL